MMDAEQVIRDFDDWIEFRAWTLNPTGDLVEDLIQEARIAIWKILPKYDSSRGTLSSYIATTADFRMRLMLSTHRWTGGQKASSPHVKRTPDTPVKYINDLAESEYTIPASADMAYHRSEIKKSLDELTETQRKYVVGKFWLDEKQRALPSHGVWDGHSTNVGAKKILRDKLKHLEGIV